MMKTIYHVSFPKLNFNIDINPIFMSLGNLSVKWYGIVIAIAFLTAFFYVTKHSAQFDIQKNKMYDIILVATISAIIGARAYYVVFFPGDYYKRNPWKVFAISEGGIAIYGAIIGGILATLIICKINGMPFLKIIDLMSIGVAIGQSIGRWGNFFNQEAFGTPTELPWGMASENTLNQTVHPCFLYESLGCALIFLILHFASDKLKSRPGTLFLTYTLLYGMLRFLIEGLRTDSLIIPNTNLRVSQVLALALSLISALVLLFHKTIKQENSKSEY